MNLYSSRLLLFSCEATLYCASKIGPLNLISHCLPPDVPFIPPPFSKRKFLRLKSPFRRKKKKEKKAKRSKNNPPNQLLAHPLAPHSCSPHVIEWAME